MKKNLLRCSCFFLLLHLSFLHGKAQWVNIPDSNFVSFLTLQYPLCMNGSMMDTTCNAVMNVTSLYPYNRNISDLTGAQYFDKVAILDCSRNKLSTLPPLR